MSTTDFVVPETPPPEKKTVIVSAPGGGIGKTLVPTLIEEGYEVIGIGSERSRMFAEFLKEQKLPVEFFEVNYTSEDSIRDAFSIIKSQYTSVNGFVHLTGGSIYSKPADEITLAEFKEVLEINLTSAFLLGREVFSLMKNGTGGNMVFFGSTTGLEPSRKKLPYAVAKAGVHMLSSAFALEGSKYGIISNSVAPGYVMTDRHLEELQTKAERSGKSLEEVKDKLRSKNLLNGILEVKQLVPMVKLLLESTSIQGQVMTVDMGQISF